MRLGGRSVEATRENAAVNGVPGIAVERLDLRREEGPWAPVVVANLIRPLLLDVAGLMTRPPRDADRLRPAARGGRRGGRGVRALAGCASARGATAASGRRCGSTGSVQGMAWNVLILGGGFGGLTAARRLERKLAPHSANVTLVSDVNFMLYTPLLPGRGGGHARAAPRRRPAARAAATTPSCDLGEVTGADPDRAGRAASHVDRRRDDELPYDQLIVALGSTSRTLPIPGLAEHALGFKTLSEAIALRNRRDQRLEQAEIEDDEAARRALLTFVFVGAGYAGLEGLAELQDFAADVIERYPRCAARGHALHARGGEGPRDARGPADARRVRHRRAAQARDRGAHEHDDRGGHGATR